MLTLSSNIFTQKLKLNLNSVTSEIFTKINLNKALLVKPEKSSSNVTKLKFDFVAKWLWDDELTTLAALNIVTFKRKI